MGKIVCVICKKVINSKERVDVFWRRLGQMRILENYHTHCWERLVKKNRESLEDNTLKEIKDDDTKR